MKGDAGEHWGTIWLIIYRVTHEARETHCMREVMLAIRTYLARFTSQQLIIKHGAVSFIPHRQLYCAETSDFCCS